MKEKKLVVFVSHLYIIMSPFYPSIKPIEKEREREREREREKRIQSLD